jgi:putative protein-disulfide isomerase
MKNINAEQPVGIEVTFYTDPLCCWSWALEPHRKVLEERFHHAIKWRFCMGGLIADWNSYRDSVSNVFQPAQMGPAWMYASQVTGAHMKDSIWVNDPPASSYPACVAVKCAALQSAFAEENYLLELRKAVMEQGLNIAKEEVLIEVAKKLEEQFPEKFDAEQFTDDLQSGGGREEFRNDLGEMRIAGIERMPTLVLRRAGQKSILVSGYRPLDTLIEIFAHALGEETGDSPQKSA